MAWMKVDDRLHAARKVEEIPKRYRLAAVGLWTLSGSWIAQEETDGFVPEHKARSLGGTPAVIEQLIAVRLWHRVEGGYQFHEWLAYNPSKSQTAEAREASAKRMRESRERKAKAAAENAAESTREAHATPTQSTREAHATPTQSTREAHATPTQNDLDDIRAGQDVAPGDVALQQGPMLQPQHEGTLQRPDPTRPDPTLVTSGHRWAEPNGEYAPEVEKPRGPAVDIDGWKLVRDAIPDEHPQASRSALALEAGTLIKAGTKPETVRAALDLWLTKPHLGPRTLPSLVSEVIRNRHAPARTGYGYGHDAATDKVTGWLELAEQLGQEAQA